MRPAGGGAAREPADAAPAPEALPAGTLVELELLMSQATDTRDEFVAVYDFDQAFERDYPWCAQFV